MKIKSVSAIIGLLGALLLVMSLITVGKVSGSGSHDLLVGSQSLPQIAEILPQQSSGFLSLLAKPEQLGLFAKLAAQPHDRAEISNELKKLKQQLSQNWLLDYERDVQPWLGREVAIAITSIDLDHQPSNGLQTGYLLAFTIQDRKLAKGGMDNFWQKLAVAGVSTKFEQYRGLPILSGESEKHTVAQTITDKFVLFANDKRVLHQVIDTIFSPESAIANLDSYKSSLFRDKPNGKFGFAYANLADFGEGDFSKNILVSLNLDKSGIRLKTTSSALSQSPLRLYGDVLNKLPRVSSVVLGNDLSQTLQNFEKTLPTISKKYLAKTLFPIPTDSRVWSWLRGNYAIASIPNATSKSDWLLVSKVDNAGSIKAAITELDDLFRSKFTIGEITVKQQPVTIWTNLSAIANDRFVSGNIAIAHAQTPEYIYFSSSLPILESALSSKPKQAIATSKNFTKIISGLGKGQSTYAYTATETLQRWQQEIYPTIESSPFPLIFKHLDSIGIAMANTPLDSINGEIFLQLK